MKIVVIGGTGLIGSKLVAKLVAHGHDAVPASPGTGVNTLTGEGLTEALAGTDAVVDVSNSPSFEDTAVLEFFETSTRNILDAEAAAGVVYHVALSVVGTERLAESGYMRAKIAQEKLIKNSSTPYTIVHATQFFEFAIRTADEATDGETVRVPPVLIQPMAADDVAAAVCDVTLAAPLNNTIEIAGPEPLRFEDFVRERLRSVGDQRAVVADPQARYFGARLGERTLLPGDGAQLAPHSRTGSASRHPGGDHVRRRDHRLRVRSLFRSSGSEEHPARTNPPGALKCPQPSLPTLKLTRIATRPIPTHTSVFASPMDPVPTDPSSSTFRTGQGSS